MTTTYSKHSPKPILGKILLLIITLALVFCPNAAFAAKKHHKIHHRAGGGLVSGTASYSDIVIDAGSGRILHADSADKLRHPASLTKMMTLYLVFQAIETGKLGLNQYLPISANAAEQPPSKLGLRAGSRIRVEDAILGLVTESANDAAVVFAEWLGGSDAAFGRMMTKQAHALGMTRSNFDNPSGLPDPDQVTTARDMAVLGYALINHFPQYYPYFSRGEFTYAGLDHANHNHLMERYEGMDGIKTGYIRASGFNLVASAVRGNTRVIGVVFGGHSTLARDNRMAQLLDNGFAVAPHEDKIALAIDAAQGDGEDEGEGDSNGYITLPAKTLVVFAPREAALKVPAAPDNPAPTANAGWGIQIGAYSDPEVARQAMAGVVNEMPQVLGSAVPDLEKVASGGTVVWRARLMAIDASTAQSVCATLSKEGQHCMTIGP